MAIKPEATYTLNGVTISEKIIPDDMRWTNANAAKAAGFSLGSLYKNGNRLSGGIGKAQWVTIHNTEDLIQTYDDAERYVQATYNQAMGASRPHFYIDETSVWQLLKAGTGLCANDPEGSAEVNWTCGDGVVKDGGNVTSISLEVIMNENPTSDAKAKDNAARIAAWLLWKHGLTIDRLVTHTFWVNKSVGKTFADVDKQCTNPVAGQKWCPYYIFGSTNAGTAYNNWRAFKALVEGYLNALNISDKVPTQNIDSVGARIKIGDVVQFKGGSVYVSSTAKSATATKGASVCTVTNIYSKGTHKYHLKSNDGKGVYGWVNASDVEGAEVLPPAPAPSGNTAVNVGDIVRFKGGNVYLSANAVKASSTRSESRCKVTAKHSGGKHPYHLISEDGKGVWGWVDSDNVTK